MRSLVGSLAVLALLGVAGGARGDRDPAAVLAEAGRATRRTSRAELLGAAGDADRRASSGEPGGYETAARLYLLAYRAHRVAEDLTTAIDRLEHATRAGGAVGCGAARAVAATYAELVGPASGYLAFHRLRVLCADETSRDAAARALEVLSSFRPEPGALAAVERDPNAPLPPRTLPATAAPLDAGPPIDAGQDAAVPVADAGRAKRARDAGPERLRIRFSDAGE